MRLPQDDTNIFYQHSTVNINSLGHCWQTTFLEKGFLSSEWKWETKFQYWLDWELMSCFGMATVSPVTSEEPEVISTSYTYVIMCTVLALTAMAAFLGNLMVIAVIIRTSKLHTITWCLLLNLASSDFLSAALLVPMVISIQPSNGGMPQHWLCTLIGFTYTVLAEASVWTLALLSIERYFAVNQPLHYHQRVTKHRAIVAVCSLWICALCWSSAVLLPGYSFHRQFRMCLPMLGVAATLAFIGIGICLPFVILCCMYISIGRTAFTQAQRKVIECNEDNCRYVAPKHKDYRAVKILALLAGKSKPSLTIKQSLRSINR